ncbi:MAG: hypothetical protein A4E74_00580 [Syntrophus sp. PtaB.Bin075]|nr:MAG: hypothetical protein A4E74_00580 [Syntrophus sp. PtaB.Bin075]
MDSYSLIHNETLIVKANYDSVKVKIQGKLHDYRDLFKFNDDTGQIRYPTEGPLIPHDNDRIPILILLSNPHPHSVRQGMFLSPNRIGNENPLWDTLRSTGYFNHTHRITPSLMIENKYDSPFRIFIAVLLSFPSNFPNELPEIFGREEYQKMIIAGKARIETLLKKHDIKNVICFGKTQYEIMASSSSPERYTNILRQGTIIRCSSSLSPHSISIFLTYPTGWRYDVNSRNIKVENLKKIMEIILNNSDSSWQEADEKGNKNMDSPSQKESPPNIWFVVHHHDLWDIDNRLIGFYNRNQWLPLNINDLIIYYRAGFKGIMGVFKVIEKGVNLNRSFYVEDIAEKTIHQCRLELLSDDIICYRPTTESRFSFFDSWVSTRYGLRKQVFPANQ